MTHDPSLAVSIQQWRNAHLTFNGTAWVFTDGIDFENIRHAIHVAWLAQDFYLALDLACRYGIDAVLCLRCTQRHVRPVNLLFRQPNQWIPSAAWHSLCEHCCLDLMGVK